jgi:hypothetical protein
VRDDDSFAGGEAVGFDDDRIARIVAAEPSRLGGLDANEARRRNSRALHEFLRMNLAGLELRGISCVGPTIARPRARN